MNNEQTTFKPLVSVKNAMRVLALLAIIFAFCPAFLVSCAEAQKEVGVMTAVEGVSIYGEEAVEPHPIMIICILLPIAIMLLLLIKNIVDRTCAVLVTSCAVIDIITWFIFRKATIDVCEENYCEFKTTPWFVVDMIVLCIIACISFLVILDVLEMEMDLVLFLTGKSVHGDLEQIKVAVNNVANRMAEVTSNSSSSENSISSNSKKKYIGYCFKCGSGIEYGIKFCPSCGKKVTQEMLDEAEEERRLLEEKRLAEEKAAKEAEERRIAEEKAAKEAEARRLAEEKAAKEAVERRIAEEKAAKEAEERRLAEERAAKEAEQRRITEEKAAQEARNIEEELRMATEGVAKDVELMRQIDEGQDTIVYSDKNNNQNDNMKKKLTQEAEGAFCENCGAKLKVDYLFCRNCGTKVQK